MDDKEFEGAAEALDAETEDAVAEVQGANPPALAPVHTEAQKEKAAAAEEVQVPVPAPATNANPPVEEAEDAAVQCVTVPAPATNGAEGEAANSEEDPFTLRGNNQAERIRGSLEWCFICKVPLKGGTFTPQFECLLFPYFCNAV